MLSSPPLSPRTAQDTCGSIAPPRDQCTTVLLPVHHRAATGAPPCTTVLPPVHHRAPPVHHRAATGAPPCSTVLHRCTTVHHQCTTVHHRAATGAPPCCHRCTTVHHRAPPVHHQCTTSAPPRDQTCCKNSACAPVQSFPVLGSPSVGRRAQCCQPPLPSHKASRRCAPAEKRGLQGTWACLWACLKAPLPRPRRFPCSFWPMCWVAKGGRGLLHTPALCTA